MAMTGEEAKDKLKKVAHQYHTVKWELTELDNGELIQVCTIYISGEDFYHGGTWEKAFAEREKMLGIETPIDTIAAQMP